jgi:protein-disulfide isomerase
MRITEGLMMTKMMKQWMPAAALVVVSSVAMAQAPVAKAPAAQTPAPAAQAPSAQIQKPQSAAPVAQGFPPVNLKNFTADSPTTAEVNDFLKALWGYDENRTWSVAAILKTAAPGVAKVVVFAEEAGQSGQKTTIFFTTPDGKHAIADQVIDFGAKPFAANRKLLQDRAEGAAQGATGKDLMLVEFADLQCPRCKEAQDTMNKLAADFPQARIVYENFPLTEIHPFAYAAAAEGVCVRKAKGDAAFFTYAQNVYNKQEGLTTEGAATTLTTAVAAAGADAKTVSACAKSEETKKDIEASIQLGKDLGVDQTPLLFANGHVFALNGVPYETLKKVIAYQAGQDGVVVHMQPTLSTLK